MSHIWITHMAFHDSHPSICIERQMVDSDSSGSTHTSYRFSDVERAQLFFEFCWKQKRINTRIILLLKRRALATLFVVFLFCFHFLVDNDSSGSTPASYYFANVERAHLLYACVVVCAQTVNDGLIYMDFTDVECVELCFCKTFGSLL